jgi:DNA-binding MarR family transcriptional regulator
VRQALNDAAMQMSLLQRSVGARLDLRDVDLECLNIVNAEGPLSPSALARRAGLHPATITGVIDRLERAGWVVRERNSGDRRAVQVEALRDRNRELYDLLGGMSRSMAEILEGFSAEELGVIADFLARTIAAGKTATEELQPDN